LRRPAAGRIAGWVVVLALIGSLLPVGAALAPGFSNLGAHLRGAPLALDENMYKRFLMRELCAWLRDHTPPTRGYLDTGVPEYGVLALWSNGHAIEYVGRRATVTNNFGDDIGRKNFQRARKVFRVTALEAEPLLEELGVRYVIAELDVGRVGGRHGPDSLHASLYFMDGARGLLDVADGGSRVVVPAADRFRLVYESAGNPSAPQPPLATYKLFERVAGARVTGKAPPGYAVEAQLELDTPRGRPFTFSTQAVADPAGDYGLVLPYPTQATSGAVRSKGPYRLLSGPRTETIQVSEEAVQTGAVIVGPNLRR
jgi:asparagine N-glycosylation enzyme membrane subunit Stt3